MTPEQLAICTGANIELAKKYLEPIEREMYEFEIDRPLRIAAFLAQIGHESGGLQYTTEIWGPTKAQAKYEFRKDLGNNQPGDGRKYCGRGFIQITGKLNYHRISQDLNIDFVSHPELLAEPEFAAKSAAWFWKKTNLNYLADSMDFTEITRKINGGFNGLEDRKRLYDKALQVLVFNK